MERPELKLDRRVLHALEGVRALLSEAKHWNGGGRDETETEAPVHCLTTAVWDASKFNAEAYRNALIIVGEKAVGRPVCDDEGAFNWGIMWEWNDSPERKHEDILRVFDESIADVRNVIAILEYGEAEDTAVTPYA